MGHLHFRGKEIDKLFIGHGSPSKTKIIFTYQIRLEIAIILIFNFIKVLSSFLVAYFEGVGSGSSENGSHIL